MIFTSLALLQVFQAFATRSNTESLRTIGLRSNPVMLGIAAVVVALQLLAIYTPLNGFLDLEPLRSIDLAICAALGLALLAAIELTKTRRRRQHHGHGGPAPDTLVYWRADGARNEQGGRHRLAPVYARAPAGVEYRRCGIVPSMSPPTMST